MSLWLDYQAQQWRYVFELTRAIASRLDLDSVLAKALRYAVDLIGGEAGLIALRGPGDAFHFAVHYGIEPSLLERFEPLLTEIPLTIERDQFPRWRFPELQLRFAGVIDAERVRLQHVMAIPLIASEQLLGIIYVFRARRSAAFTAMDEDALAGFADHVAIAIDHARLYHDASQRARELAAVIEGSAHGILLTDRDGRIREVNRALEQLTGWPRDAIESADFHQVLQVTDARGRAIPLPSFADAAQSVFSCEGFIKRREGVRGAYVHVTLAPLYDEVRRLLSVVANVVDLTALKETDELKDTFLAGISHDLKTPLALIRGYAETLRRTDVTWNRETVDQSLAIIEEEAEYLTHLVNTLLDAAQLERGHLPLQKSDTRVDELARKMVERFEAVHQGHHWALEFPADLAPVPADAERIRQVLQNLLTNAAKYAPQGTTVTVGGWNEPERIGVFVRDEGTGISLEEQARIFDRFTRGRGRAAQRAQGAGLGLYLARAIVEQHGGKMWLENLPERGTSFYFTLPRGEPSTTESGRPS